LFYLSITAEVQKEDKIELRVAEMFLSTEILVRKKDLVVKRKDIFVGYNLNFKVLK